MGNYFRPLRRKIGAVALFIACLFLAGWVRSFTVRDVLTFRTGTNSVVHLDSNNGLMSYASKTSENSATAEILAKTPWNVLPLFDIEKYWETSNPTWKWRLGQFGALKSNSDHQILYVPYWLVVVPLSLLSAGLLLSKPRVANSLEKTPHNF